MSTHMTRRELMEVLAKKPQGALVYVQNGANRSEPMGWDEWDSDSNLLVLDSEPDVDFALTVGTVRRVLEDSRAPKGAKIVVVEPNALSVDGATGKQRAVVGVRLYRNRVTIKTEEHSR